MEYILQKEKPDFVVLSPFVLHPLYWAKDEIVYAMEGQFEAWIKVFGDILSRWSAVDFIIISCEPTQHAILKEDRNYCIAQFNEKMKNHVQSAGLANVHFMLANLRSQQSPTGELTFGDLTHLMTRRQKARVPGSLWVQSQLIYNHFCIRASNKVFGDNVGFIPEKVIDRGVDSSI